MDKGFEVRFFQQGDDEDIVHLLDLVFDGWPKLDLISSPLEHWRWKYIDNPQKSRSVRVALSNNRIIGCAGNIILKIKIGDTALNCAQGVDFAVNPDFRGRGAITKMGELFDELITRHNVAVNYGIESNPILIARDLRRGHPHFPHTIANLVRIKDIEAHLNAIPVQKAWLMKYGFRVTKYVNKIMNIINRPISRGEGLPVHEITHFDNQIEEFWKKVSSNYRFIIERNPEYLNWRYCDPRAGGFVVRQVRENEEILGYSVLKINRYLVDYPVGFIVDLLAIPDRLDVADKLVEDAIGYFDDRDVNIINYLVVKNHPYESVVRSRGFLDSRIKFHLFYVPTAPEVANEMRSLEKLPASKVFYSWGDHDTLPVSLPSYR